MSNTSEIGNGSKRSVRKKRRVFLWVILSLVILLVVAYLGISAFAATQLSKPVRNFNPDLNPGAYGLDYEEVRYPARNDGLEIAAWYIPSEENDRVIILVHGRDNSRINSVGICRVYCGFQ